MSLSAGNYVAPDFAAVAVMTGLFWANFMTVIGVMYAFGYMSISLPSPLLAIATAFIPAIPLYFLLVFRGKSERVLNRFEGEPRRQKIIGRIIAISCIVLSVGGMTGAFFLMMMKNRGEL